MRKLPYPQTSARWIIEETPTGCAYWPANTVAVTICNRYNKMPLRVGHMREAWDDAKMLLNNGEPLVIRQKVDELA